MRYLLNSFHRLHDDESGQGLVEYLLIMALGALAVMRIFRALSAARGVNVRSRPPERPPGSALISASNDSSALSFRRGCGRILYEKVQQMEKRSLNYLACLHDDEEGQGLVEYLLIIAMVAFAATAGLHSIANSVNSSFTAVGSFLGVYIT